MREELLHRNGTYQIFLCDVTHITVSFLFDWFECGPGFASIGFKIRWIVRLANSLQVCRDPLCCFLHDEGTWKGESAFEVRLINLVQFILIKLHFLQAQFYLDVRLFTSRSNLSSLVYLFFWLHIVCICCLFDCPVLFFLLIRILMFLLLLS